MLTNFLNFIIEKEFYLIVVYVLLGFVCYKILKVIITNFTKNLKKKRQVTIQKLIQNIIKYLIIIIVITTVLNLVGVNITSIVAGLGVASVILSLALKDMMQDILAGISIIFEDQFDVGDLVEINGFTGTIYDLGLKSTKIKSYENVIKIIANRTITEVTNYSKTSPNLVMDIPMSYDVKNEIADKVVQNILKRIKKEINTINGEVELWGLNELADSHLNYRILIPVEKNSQFESKRKVNRIIKEEYDKANISTPYNIIEVKNG